MTVYLKNQELIQKTNKKNNKTPPSVEQIKLQKALLFWSTATFFYFFQFILRVSPSSCADLIMERLHINAGEFGQIIALYYIGYAFLQIPAGIILDRFGPRIPGFLAILTCSTGVLIFALCDQILPISIARFLMGMGSAFALLTNIKVASTLFSSKKLPLFIGLTLMTGTIGAIFAGAPLAIFIEKIGAQNSLLILSCCGIAYALAFVFILAPLANKTNVSAQGINNISLKEILFSLKEILSLRFTYGVGFFGLLMYLPLSGFSELWAPSFFEDTHNYSTELATFLSSCTFIGMGVGSPLWSFFHAKFKNYYKEMVVSALLTFTCFTLVFYTPIKNPYLYAVLLFLGGLCLSGQFLAYSFITEKHHNSRTAMANGTHNMMCMISGMIAQPLIGYFIDLGGRLPISDRIVYSLKGYQMGFGTISLGLLLALFALLLTRRDMYLKEKEEEKF